MKKILSVGAALVIVLVAAVFSAAADQRGMIYSLGLDLERQATELAESNFAHFKGRSSEISDEEQAALFKAESFAASCRLFLRLTEERSDFYNERFLRTNLYSAFMYLAASFREFEEEMKKARIMPFSLSDCRRTLDRMDKEFAKWPSADNLAYLHQKYVKAADASVYMIERQGAGTYILHAFKSLESLYRYNYDLKRGKDPWKHLVEVEEGLLKKMQRGDIIDLTFEGKLIIEQSTRPNRPVFRIENGKKRGITSPQILSRYGGWSKVFEVPDEVISSYPEGDPIY